MPTPLASYDSGIRSEPATAVDLFCGAGGLTLGLLQAGFHLVGAVENWGPAMATYRANFDHPVLERDIGQLTPECLLPELGFAGRLDLLAGGPPCQGFSVQRIGSDRDERNSLVLRFAAFVAALRPRVFLMENVPGLLGKRGKEVAADFEQQMRAEGYAVQAYRVNAADYGVPQTRRRVLFIGWQADEAPFRLPSPSHTPDTYVSVWDAICDLEEPPDDFQPARNDPMHRRTRLSSLNLERLRHIPPGGGFEDLPVDLRVACHRAGADRIGHRNVYGRLAPDRPAGTVTGRFDSFTRGKFGHPFEDRNITLREGARLQSFPDSHQFLGTQEEVAALIGNAVPPWLAAAVASAIMQSLVSPRQDAQGQPSLSAKRNAA